MISYTTVRQAGEDQFTEKRSRFICAAAPVESAGEADGFVARRRGAHRDARHTVWAYRLRSGEERCSDDGEPQGTGGVPMLEVVRREDIVDVCVVVSRYFGGILLGAPGLTRAYAAGAVRALAAAGKRRMALCFEYTVIMDYPQYNRTAKLLGSPGVTVKNSLFGAQVVLKVVVRQEDAAGFEATLTALTAGTVNPEKTGQIYAFIPESSGID